MELVCGAVNKNELARINKSIDRFNIIPLDSNITKTAITLVQSFSLSNKLAIPDGLITTTAIETGLELFTYNLKDYKFIPGVRLFKHK